MKEVRMSVNSSALKKSSKSLRVVACSVAICYGVLMYVFNVEGVGAKKKKMKVVEA